MIYTVVADTKKFKEAYENAQIRDCHDTWQPLTLIPKDVLDYIKNGKSEEIKTERLAAYSTLFFALFSLYGNKNFAICRKDSGKPYLTENGEISAIRISISHTDGAVAVALSDEYEVGVDVQSEIDESRAERLEKRFFNSINTTEESIPPELLNLRFGDNEMSLEPIKSTNIKVSDFTKKWAYCESLLKCDGGGFGSLEKISDIQKQTNVSIYTVEINEKPYAVATAVKSAKM